MGLLRVHVVAGKEKVELIYLIRRLSQVFFPPPRTDLHRFSLPAGTTDGASSLTETGRRGTGVTPPARDDPSEFRASRASPKRPSKTAGIAVEESMGPGRGATRHRPSPGASSGSAPAHADLNARSNQPSLGRAAASRGRPEHKDINPKGFARNFQATSWSLGRRFFTDSPLASPPRWAVPARAGRFTGLRSATPSEPIASRNRKKHLKSRCGLRSRTLFSL